MREILYIYFAQYFLNYNANPTIKSKAPKLMIKAPSVVSPPDTGIAGWGTSVGVAAFAMDAFVGVGVSVEISQTHDVFKVHEGFLHVPLLQVYPAAQSVETLHEVLHIPGGIEVAVGAKLGV